MNNTHHIVTENFSTQSNIYYYDDEVKFLFDNITPRLALIMKVDGWGTYYYQGKIIVVDEKIH